MAKQVLGHIDCPACFTPGGIRVTADRNGKPFGFCEANCNFQMRIGGNAKREAAFAERYPWVAAEIQQVVDGAAPAKAPVLTVVPKPEPKPIKVAKAGPFDFLMNKGQKEGAPA